MVLHLPFLAVFAFIYTDEIIRLIFDVYYTRSGKWIKPVTEEGKAMVSNSGKNCGGEAFSFAFLFKEIEVELISFKKILVVGNTCF